MKTILRATFAGLGLVLSATLGSATTIFDDFNDGENGTPQWIQVDAGAQIGAGGSISYGPGNNEYQLTGAALASARPGFVITDGTARVELTDWNPSVSGGSSVGLVIRFAPETLSGYFLSIDLDASPNLNLVKLAGGAPGINAAGPTKLYDLGKSYILEAIASGNTITGTVYEKDGDTVTQFDQVVLVDNSPHAAGLCGLLVANDAFPNSTAAARATFDNFFATDGTVAQPTLVNPSVVDGLFTFGVSGEAGRPYLVEFRENLENAAWMPLTNFPAMSVPGTSTVTDGAAEPQRFYRASTPVP